MVEYEAEKYTYVHVKATGPEDSTYRSGQVRLVACSHLVGLFYDPVPLRDDRGLRIDSGIRTYIRIHDENCRCAWGITNVSNTIIQQPTTLTQSGPEHSRNMQMQPGATIFNSLFFPRQDGLWRNAMGEVLKMENIDQPKPVQLTPYKLSELVDIVESYEKCSPFSDGSTNHKLLHHWMDFPAEVLGAVVSL